MPRGRRPVGRHLVDGAGEQRERRVPAGGRGRRRTGRAASRRYCETLTPTPAASCSSRRQRSAPKRTVVVFIPGRDISGGFVPAIRRAQVMRLSGPLVSDLEHRATHG